MPAEPAPVAAPAPGSVLDPVGPEAAQIAGLTWFMIVLGGLLWLATVVFLVLALRHRAHREPRANDRGAKAFIAVWGVVVPVVVLPIVFVYSLVVGVQTSRPAPPGELTVEVVGHQFWWEVRYPEAGVVTANEIHVPVDRPVRLELTSADVIHSLWIPPVAGKLDLFPGHTNVLSLQVDEAGRYLGECAEFCGIQHARMQFVLVAQEEEEFSEHLRALQAGPAEPGSDLAEAGREVFLAAGCGQCHRIEDVSEGADFAPDLTHLATRDTIAAGMLENTRGNLAGWILDPQGLKSGVRMPPSNLSGEDLQALLAYLEGLR
ncbi:cytochrome c oxidase subunit II [Blastococcus sp. MG754426]|uniref:cytochrome c oxidase subunit II n=1 Tax=unclassified Blastococcus TaxID=2619396 RepID=UPI001EEFF113|nr:MULTISPECIES: cytochrome c oxidase subunit II [unclassified Blastococcus]MCF6506059.1 cytochrome c oxidase subunit II [Blastococcus sp. MG754426]MCF6510555.1 cytochrome c oxidase subunit II [Blastococcus sp. MG754427]MCF6735632.1 cytochrome c oxidase subunit II [Blastococcus sp. KM273129]